MLSVAHIHFAPTKVAGGVMIFLCVVCSPAGLSSGHFGNHHRDDYGPETLTGPTTQGIDIGDLYAALEAVRAGLGYVNMHTVNFAGGEICGQVHRDE